MNIKVTVPCVYGPDRIGFMNGIRKHLNFDIRDTKIFTDLFNKNNSTIIFTEGDLFFNFFKEKLTERYFQNKFEVYIENYGVISACVVDCFGNFIEPYKELGYVDDENMLTQEILNAYCDSISKLTTNSQILTLLDELKKYNVPEYFPPAIG